MVSTGERYADKLRSKSKNTGIRADRLQKAYAKERVLFRLAEVFPEVMVKGSTADYARSPGTARFAPDLDLSLPERRDDLDLIVRDFLSRTVCDENGAVDDGLDVLEVVAEDLRPRDESGVKLRVFCKIGWAKPTLKIDIAFGNCRPDPLEVAVYPNLFPGFPATWVRLQPVAYKLADKLHAMAEHQERNTRVKDVWDLAWHLRRGSVTHDEFARAVMITFAQRGTGIDPAPACLTGAWAVAQERLWAKWHVDMGLPQEQSLVEAVEEIRQPLQRALVRARSLQAPLEPHLRLVPSAA